MTAATPSSGSSENLNLSRRALPGLLARCVLTPLDPLLRLCTRPPIHPQGLSQKDRAAPHSAAEPVFVFASYMVGDLFMALPALKRLAAARPVYVLCRPDCVGLIAREGLERLIPIPFDNAFLTTRSCGAFLRTFRAARALRRHPETASAPLAIDLDASPLSALWLRLAGFPRVASYRRAYGALFTETFDLPVEAVHQADRDEAVVGYVLKGGEHKVGSWETVVGGKHRDGGSETVVRGEHRDGGSETVVRGKHRGGGSETVVRGEQHDLGENKVFRVGLPSTVSKPPSLWLFSVWTRKASKNWPLEQWDGLLENLVADGVDCTILIPPDADDAFHTFRARWEVRSPSVAVTNAPAVTFVGGSLEDVAVHVHNAAGVVATDNFLGHMAGYYGKPVLWINLSSPSAQVRPRGPRTLEVAADERGQLAVESVARAFHALRRDA